MNESIEDKVIRLIAEHLGTKAKGMTPETCLESDLLVDSLDLLELVMVFEDEFDVEIPDDEAEKLKTVGDVIAMVKRAQ